MIKNLIILGMGGQGVKLVSTLVRKVIGMRFGRFSGFEERGGAQRYGPVASAIRFSIDSGYDGPLGLDFKDGGADYVLSLEASEPLRYFDKIGEGTLIVTDSYIVPPTNVRRNDGDYYTIEQLSNQYLSSGCSLHVRNFREIAQTKTQTPLNANILALGYLIGTMNGILTVNDFAGLVTTEQLELMQHGLTLAGGNR